MSLTAALDGRPHRPSAAIDHRPIRNRRIQVVVQGCGTWTTTAIQPDLRRLHYHLTVHQRHPGLSVAYLGITPAAPLPVDTAFEQYVCLNAEREVIKLYKRKLDLIIIATPDHSHIDDARHWLKYVGTPRAILIEKPLSNESFEARRFADDVTELAPRTPILGIDHYNWYAWPHAYRASEIDGFLAGIEQVSFAMLEHNPIEANRLRSVGSGMTFDMASHLLGLLSLGCDLRSYADLAVHYAAKHQFDRYNELRDRRYFAETSVELSFSVTPWGSTRPINVYGRIGKAASLTTKYFELLNDRGRLVRIPLGPPPPALPSSSEQLYPHGTMFGASVAKQLASGRHGFPDPFDLGWFLLPDYANLPLSSDFPMPWTRHGQLVAALSTGSLEVFDSLLTLDECSIILRMLEDIREQILGLKTHEPSRQQWTRDWPGRGE